MLKPKHLRDGKTRKAYIRLYCAVLRETVLSQKTNDRLGL